MKQVMPGNVPLELQEFSEQPFRRRAARCTTRATIG
jgi:hypothetical protein